MEILYIGTSWLHGKHIAGKIPSHWLYGAEEMAREGWSVTWKDESKELFHDIRLLRKHCPDVVFIPNMNLRCHVLLLILCAMRIIKTPVFAFVHRVPQKVSLWQKLSYKMVYAGCRHIFFLSELSMNDAIGNGFINKARCSVPGWGPDMEFFSKVKTEDKGYFVSTGKENRDFDTLIEAFRITGAPLRILCSRQHAGRSYDDLPAKCEGISNIEVVMTDNSADVFPKMLEAMAGAKALVCPLIHENMTYCVGLSTVSDAEGLGKPLIISRNPYHSPERMKQFHCVETVDDWVKAIRTIMQTDVAEKITANHTMQRCANQMISIMKENTNK